MTNLNTTPNPFGKHSFRDNAVDSAANQTYEFDIDGSVAASVENTAAAKPKFGRRSFLTGFAGRRARLHARVRRAGRHHRPRHRRGHGHPFRYPDCHQHQR